MTDEVVPLGGDRFEQRVPVDRRRMEAMITGRVVVFYEISINLKENQTTTGRSILRLKTFSTT